jgi:hypothetical protein
LRFGAETNLLPGNVLFDKPTDVLFLDKNGDVLRLESGVDQVRISPSFGRTVLKEGVGLNLRLLKALYAEASVRTGLGARHTLARDLFFAVPSTSTTTPTYKQAETENKIGIEGSVLASARITRWVIANLEFDSLFPFDGLWENAVFELEGSVAVKLTTYVSVNYRLQLLRDPSFLTENKLALQQDILLRFSLELL